MIKRIECYVAVCDVCEKVVDDGVEMMLHHDTEAESLEYALEDDMYGGAGGQMVEDKLCCPNCWVYDDDAEPVFRPKEAK